MSYLPIALLCIAGLFYLLQPEFVPIEVSAGLYTVEYVVTVLLQIVKALGVLLLHQHWREREGVLTGGRDRGQVDTDHAADGQYCTSHRLAGEDAAIVTYS